MKNAVVTVAVGKAGEWLDISRPSMEDYAKKVGAEFVALTEKTCPPYPMGEKWQVEPLFDTYTRILFVDADIIVRPTAPDLFALIPDDHIGMYDDLPDMNGYTWYFRETEQVQREQGLRREPLPHCLNTGLVMASRQHRAVYQRPDFLRPTHCYEQHLANCRIRDAGWPVWKMSREIHWQWWSDRGRGLDCHAQFVHFSGMKDHAQRVRLMKETAMQDNMMHETPAPVPKAVASKPKGCGCGKKVARPKPR